MVSLPRYCDWFQAEYTPIPGARVSASFEKEAEGQYLLTLRSELGGDVPIGDWRLCVRPRFRPDFTYTSHLTPEEGHVVDMHVFRTPAMMMGEGDRVLCVLPEAEGVKDGKNRWYMDLDAPKGVMTLGITTTRVVEHVLYRRTGQAVLPKGSFCFRARFLTLRGEEARNPFRRVLSLYWEKGRPDLRRLPSCPALMPYVRRAYHWAFESWKDVVWQEFTMNGVRVGAPQFIVTARQSPNYKKPTSIREHLSIWNQAWFSSLRSAQGLLRYGRETGNAEYIHRAMLTKELALAFPQEGGLFDSVVAVPDETRVIDGKTYTLAAGWDRLYLGNSDRNPAFSDLATAPRHILDMSWTCLMMLAWYCELEKDRRLLDYALRYAERLLTLQDEDGFFPGWIDRAGNILPQLRQSPESAVSVTFLLRLFALTPGRTDFRDAALRCLDALARRVMPESRWEDFETYYSCSRYGAGDMPGRKFPRNNAYKQNSLSPFWMARALLEAFRLTGKRDYLMHGQRCLDEMLMFQSSFQPSWIPVTVVGGFGVMNCDAELNDARQSRFSELILEYGRELGLREYWERGEAALRASFSMMYCPENPFAKAQWEARWPFFGEADYGFMMENYGHGGYVSGDDLGLGEFTIYDWGNGAASEAVMRIKSHFKELFEPHGD